MNKLMRFTLVAVFVFMLASMANAQDIDKKVIMRVPDDIASKRLACVLFLLLKFILKFSLVSG